MKRICVWVVATLLCPIIGNTQIAHYNQYPTMHVDTYLDEYTGISFAFSMRKLFSDYAGPIIKLRRNSDNATKDFYATDTDLIDVVAINTWMASSTPASTNLYVVTWYDQSGNGRNAVQSNALFPVVDSQPLFHVDTTLPYVEGDGIDDYLVIQETLSNLVTSGKYGSVFTVAKANETAQVSLGVIDPANLSDRWALSLNYYNGTNLNRGFFDPGNFGTSSPTTRFFNNVGGAGLWKQYSLIAKSTTGILARQNGSNLSTSNSIAYTACSLTNSNFYIFAGGLSGTLPLFPSKTGFNEIIMFNTTVASDVYENIEQSQMNFWGL